MISTYDELKDAVAGWLHRDDITARIPDFISMGEAVLNRKIRTVDMETRATAAAPTNSRFMGLPDGFIEMQSMFMQDPMQEMVFIEASQIRDYVLSETDTGIPYLFTTKDEIEFNCIPNQAYTLEMHYFKKYDIARDLENWLLTNYPELYLHAALSAASLFVVDDGRISMIKGLLAEGIEEVNTQEARKRGSQLVYARVDEALTSPRRFNINTGY